MEGHYTALNNWLQNCSGDITIWTLEIFVDMCDCVQSIMDSCAIPSEVVTEGHFPMGISKSYYRETGRALQHFCDAAIPLGIDYLSKHSAGVRIHIS